MITFKELYGDESRKDYNELREHIISEIERLEESGIVDEGDLETPPTYDELHAGE